MAGKVRKSTKNTKIKRGLKTVDNVKNYPILDAITGINEDKQQDIIDTVKMMLIGASTQEEWRGLIATPPGSFLHHVIGTFYKKSSIPLEIPFFTALSYVSAYLLEKGVTVDIKGQIVRPDIWTIVLGESGTGKTLTQDFLEKITGFDPSFPDCASTAKFVEELSKKPQGFLVRDEMGKYLKQINELPHFAEQKDILLRVFSGSKIERKTKKEEFIIENPALTILGLTTPESLYEELGPDSLTDGFAQRFCFVYAPRDAERPLSENAFFDLMKGKDKIKKSWDTVTSAAVHQQYKVNSAGFEAFKETFRSLCAFDVPESFYRRIMFRAVKYALLYHVLNGKKGKSINDTDMIWAARLCYLHLKDTALLLRGSEITDFQRLCERAEAVIHRYWKEGRIITPRELIHNVRGLNKAQDANVIIRMYIPDGANQKTMIEQLTNRLA